MGRCQQAVHIGTDGKEGDVTQIQQTRVTDHNVQPERQQHVEQRHVGNAYPGVAKALQQQRQNQQGKPGQQENNDFLLLFHNVFLNPFGQARSATRSPSNPEGRSVSTTIKTMKAKMSE